MTADGWKEALSKLAQMEQAGVTNLVDDDGHDEQHAEQDHMHVRADLHESMPVLDKHDKKAPSTTHFNAAVTADEEKRRR